MKIKDNEFSTLMPVFIFSSLMYKVTQEFWISSAWRKEGKENYVAKNDENFAAGEDKKFVGIYLFCDRIINGRSDCISIDKCVTSCRANGNILKYV